jgi:hypothetical protein
VRSYIPEKRQKGQRRWQGKAEEQQATYDNRRRVQGDYGKRLLKRRGELVERSFAHCYETGGMRRCHLRGRENILKRQLAHVSSFNLSLVMRQLLGAGTPRELKNRAVQLVLRLFLLLTCQMSPKNLLKKARVVATNMWAHSSNRHARRRTDSGWDVQLCVIGAAGSCGSSAARNSQADGRRAGFFEPGVRQVVQGLGPSFDRA